MTVLTDTAFIDLLNRSFAGSVVTLCILLWRFAMKKMPKKYICLLWLLPFIRLLVPLSIPSPLSLLPVNAEPIIESSLKDYGIPTIHTGIEALDAPANIFLIRELQPDPFASANPSQIWLFILRQIWLVGAIGFLAVNVLLYIRLKLRLSGAGASSGGEEEKGVYYSDRIAMPIVLGVLRPGIYLPFYLSSEEEKEDRMLILAHENAHKARRDHQMKCVAFVTLAVHWFNPLVWLAFFLYNKDVEMACDERVMEVLGTGRKKSYSLALLHFKERQSGLFLPPAFGESHTESRIKNILNYKKPGFWAVLLSIVLVGIAAVAFLTNPESQNRSFVSVIGGADGPTSIYIAGKLGDFGEGEGAEIVQADLLNLEAAKNKPYGPAVELDRVSADRIAFHGTFGYLAFDFENGTVPKGVPSAAFTLNESGPIKMQGDDYTEVVAGENAVLVIPGAYEPEPGSSGLMQWYLEETGQTYSADPKLREALKDMAASGVLADAPIDAEQTGALAVRVREIYGSELLYGPVHIPEFDSVVYGFLAADGENLEDIWYGIWYFNENAVTEPLRKIELFQ